MNVFRCPYAERGQDRCPSWRCDCFIETHPDSPFDLHPEVFVVGTTDPQPRKDRSHAPESRNGGLGDG